MITDFKPGRYELISLFLVNFQGKRKDLAGMFSKINIYEDIFSSTISGDITIEDGQDLLHNFPITGNERIQIQFRTDKNFKIIKLDCPIFEISASVEISPGGAKVHSLAFTSDERLYDQTTYVKRSIKGKNCQSISSILKTELLSQKAFVADACVNTTEYVPAMHRPFEAIFLLASRAKSQQTSSPSYVFYETTSSFNFRSLEQLAQQPVLAKYTQKNIANVDIDAEERFYNIELLERTKLVQNTEKLTSGSVGSTVAIFDPLTRTLSVNKKTSKDNQFQKTKTLGKDTKDTKSVKDDFKFHTPEGLFKIVVAGSKSETLQERYKQLNQYTNQFVLQIAVPGNSDLEIGKVLQLEIQSQIPTQANSVDPEYSGKYIVTALKHTLTTQNYRCFMEVNKDSLDYSPYKNLDAKNKIQAVN